MDMYEYLIDEKSLGVFVCINRRFQQFQSVYPVWQFVATHISKLDEDGEV